MIPKRPPLALLALALLACDGPAADPMGGAPPDAMADAAPDLPDMRRVDMEPDAAPDMTADVDMTADADLIPVPGAVRVRVTLDGAPAAGVMVVQGGAPIDPETALRTDAAGLALVPLDTAIPGDLYVIASHPRARQRGEWIIDGIDEPVHLPLTTFGPDNPDYRFQDPGEPRRRNTTAQCGHCHLTINDAWFGSAHQRAARNPVVHDLYAGTAAAFDDPETCAANGGTWRVGRIPGQDEPGGRCHLGDGLLPARNPGCADGPCDAPEDTGGCADCHAPAMNGALGGRDLLDARAIAYDYGISCDVCHRVESVLDAGPPGIAGRLKLHRPSDPGPITLGAGGVLPLTFGPSHDSPNPRMGSVQRDHYRDGRICSGCHQHDIAPDGIDRARWPGGRLPAQSTWAEWRDGPLADAPCQSCHMPPEPGAANSADLQAFLPAALIGIQAGWFRPPGSVRRHRWLGPRVEDGMAERAAAVFVRPTRDGDRIEARVEVRNVGAGHALPTGEALREVVLRVEALCDGAPLDAIDGDAVPAWGGAVDTRLADEDWRRWPDARPGDVIRVVDVTDGWHDYEGFGPFGDGSFTPEGKGMPIERVVGSATVTAVADGRVETDRPLPDGDRAHLTRGGALAGAPGFGFARIMTAPDGRRVPHFLATDVRSDNRLLPGARWTSRHAFDGVGCPAPIVRARLIYRAWPWALGRERGWTPRTIEMARVERAAP